MTARFILSLDCEGKWGVADSLTPFEHGALSTARLTEAYGKILALLDEFDVAATFAFVGLFGEGRESLAALIPELDRLAERSPGYLGAALSDIQEGSRDGWHGDWAVEVVQGARTKHEIALHGVTHVPWGSIARDFARDELALLSLLQPALRQAETFVFPRNEVAHVDLLAGVGIKGYRLARTFPSRAASLASEFNLLSEPDESVATKGDLCPIPAGYFINWRHGARWLVPRGLSRLRAQRMLRRAGKTGRIVHYWLHPENIASAPATLDNLRDVIAAAARMRDAGRCEILTQKSYCRAQFEAA
jgi:peptidoglycan/xylan/chitin deacetylase (PgdA/CDA1 family)